METWSCLSEGKGLTFADEMDFHIDGYPRNTKLSYEFDQKPFYGFEQNVEFTDTNFPEMARKPLYSYSSGKEMLTFQDEESVSSISNPFVESNGQSSSLIDLKLGRMTDFTRTQNISEFRGKTSVVSDVSAALPAKRARSTQIATPVCQVYGCNKDLSASKDYHKRHKVCDAHSKTSRVIVNGIEQRFCQQCSRFHLLSEFDDGKRSCRRRLAGHNERRRKSHLHDLAGESHGLLRSSPGFTGMSAKNPKFLSPDVYTGGILYAEGPELLTTHRHASHKLFLQAQGTKEHYGPDLPPSAAGRDDHTSSCKASAFPELSGVSLSSSSGGSCRALSLLSTKSQDYLSGPIPSFRPSSMHQTDATNQNIGRMLESTFEKSFTGRHIQSPFCLYATKPSCSAHPHQMLFQEPELLNTNSSHSPERGSTVDLLQLSSHLRRVEQQRKSFNVKHKDFKSP